ncbi:unnamed protein product [Acanthoscelides obtectus]|uniref:Uncharacterized protein n=1 Tax=Acanthoscelides obtectus TaxID=200917 RepID=A0A9P0PSH4_ACAOB|nr:unnamed protein product [Acanthoscelides obtectus]CAK1633355.1 hypothetical protein AOBTE_LOCUS8068 [Acanthoscelides obtectus]
MLIHTLQTHSPVEDEPEPSPITESASTSRSTSVATQYSASLGSKKCKKKSQAEQAYARFAKAADEQNQRWLPLKKCYTDSRKILIEA